MVLLDNPVWSALTTGNKGFAEGGDLAKRYPADMAPFAATAEPTPGAFAALASLTPPGGRVALTTVAAFTAPAPLFVETQKPIVQMIMRAPAPTAPQDQEPLTLGEDDVNDMLALTERTRPGPFGRRTIHFGRYIGLRSDGRLVAMAGERMRLDGFVEISAVCVDPSQRGKGLAGWLMSRLAQRIQTEGAAPILHVFADNANAIALYRRLGFVRRRDLVLTVLGSR